MMTTIQHAKTVVHELARTCGTPYPRAGSHSNWDRAHAHLQLDEAGERRLVAEQIRALRASNPYAPGDERMRMLFAFGESLERELGEVA